MPRTGLRNRLSAGSASGASNQQVPHRLRRFGMTKVLECMTWELCHPWHFVIPTTRVSEKEESAVAAVARPTLPAGILRERHIYVLNRLIDLA